MPPKKEPYFPYRQAVLELTEAMKKLVLLAASQQPLTYATGYADGTWKITLLENGTVVNEGYAAEMRGRYSQLDDLALFELAGLMTEAKVLPA